MDEQNNQHEYRTGRTQPRKNHSGPVAVLLIAVIFFTGLVSALGLLNIRLFKQMNSLEQNPICFTPETAQTTDPTDKSNAPSLGMRFQKISPQYQSIHDLPEGLYISWVRRGSNAAKLGIQVGDVLTTFEGAQVEDPETLRTLLHAHKAGDRVEITVFRDGKLYPLTLTVDHAE